MEVVLILTRIKISELSSRLQAKLSYIQKQLLQLYPNIDDIAIRLYQCNGFHGGKSGFYITYTIKWQFSDLTTGHTKAELRTNFTKGLSQTDKNTILRAFRQQYNQYYVNINKS